MALDDASLVLQSTAPTPTAVRDRWSRGAHRRARIAQAGRVERSVAGGAAAPGVRAAAPGDRARELDAEVARLLRVRGGELVEPLGWQRPWLRLRVAAILAQLEPIRTQSALRSSWDREASRGPDVRLAYAITFLSLERRASAPRTRRRKSRVAFSPITAHG
jgi:hypothetical protein